MAKNSLQEKFQTSYPYKQEDDEGKTWQWAKDGALKPRPASGGYSANSIAHSWQAKPTEKIKYVARKAADNGIPVWTDMQEETLCENGGMPLQREQNNSDVTKSVVAAHSLKTGFTVHDMDSVDDEYTGANQDHFYGLVVGPDDGGNVVEGFVERNNYLDRI